MGEECSGQDDEEADVEEQDRQPLPHLHFAEQPAACQCHECPEQDEPPCSVEMLLGKGSPHLMLSDGGGCNGDGDEGQEQEGEVCLSHQNGR